MWCSGMFLGVFCILMRWRLCSLCDICLFSHLFQVPRFPAAPHQDSCYQICDLSCNLELPSFLVFVLLIPANSFFFLFVVFFQLQFWCFIYNLFASGDLGFFTNTYHKSKPFISVCWFSFYCKIMTGEYSATSHLLF